MPYQCKICEKVLPTRTGIWNHLNKKHDKEVTQETTQQGKKRRNLTEFIICQDDIKPVNSQPGRPQDCSLEIQLKIRVKSERNEEDISLKTMMNCHAQEVLRGICTLDEEQTKKYLRNPLEEYQSKPYEIENELPAKQKKILKFLNRMKVLFTKEVIQQIDSHANKIKIAHEEEAIEDPIINLIFNQAAQYSLNTM